MNKTNFVMSAITRTTSRMISAGVDSVIVIEFCTRPRFVD